MTVLSAQTISAGDYPIVDPQPRTEVILSGIKTSFGVSACGYDLRLAEVDAPRSPTGDNPNWRVAPGAFVLASAIEQFDMPTTLVGIVHDKSSWARRGITVQNTVVEPGWKGFLTLEIINHSDKSIFLARGMGICQVLFHRLDHPTIQPYAGKYQDQKAAPQGAL